MATLWDLLSGGEAASSPPPAATQAATGARNSGGLDLDPGSLGRPNLSLLGLLAGAGILANNRPGVGLGEAVGGGLLGALQGYGQYQQLKRQQEQAGAFSEYRRAQAQAAQLKAAKESAAERQRAAYLEGLPPEQRALAAAAPDAFLRSAAEAQFRKPETQRPIVVGGTVLDPTTFKPLYQAPEKASAEDRQLVEIFDPASPTGTRMVPRSQAAGQPGKPASNQITVGTDENGRPLVTIGGRGQAPGSGLDKETIKKIEAKQLDTTEMGARLRQIEEGFRPEFLQLGTRAGIMAQSWKDYLGGTLAPEEKQRLEQFTTFRRDALANVNATIKDITGAAMSEAEAQRILKTLPDPGSGLLSDSPTEFQSKLKAATRDARNAMLRYSYAKAKGLDPLKVGELSEVPRLIDKRGAEIEKDLTMREPTLDEAARKAKVRETLRAEFGMP